MSASSSPSSKAFFVIIAILIVGLLAGAYAVYALNNQMTNLEAQVSQLQGEVNNLQNLINQINDKLPSVSQPTGPGNGIAFAFTNNYGPGRVYYQATIQFPSTDNGNSSSVSQSSPSVELFCGGAKWAARNGTHALFVDWLDNYYSHHLTDGVAWPWPSMQIMEDNKTDITNALQNCGFSVDTVGDIPQNLSSYDVVVLDAYWAITPQNNPQVENYLSNRGGIVLLEGTPAYFSYYCKNWWTYNLTADPNTNASEWIGGTYYNAQGQAITTVDHPFGTSLGSGNLIFEGYGWFGGESAFNSSNVVAEWNSNYILFG